MSAADMLDDGTDPLTPVLGAHAWRSNADLIADVARLHLEPTWRMIDPTFGAGAWWHRWQPAELVTHDLRLDGVDFRALPHDDGEFDAAAFDPPYISVGGRKTSTLTGDLYDRFGLVDAPTSAAGVQQLIDDGLAEVTRVVRERGLLLVKCQDYISSGYWAGTHLTLSHALELGLQLVDRFEHISGVRPQPPGRTQRHARRNHSTLFVLRKPWRGGRRG